MPQLMKKIPPLTHTYISLKVCKCKSRQWKPCYAETRCMFPQKCFHPVVTLILHCNINKTRAIPCCIANFFHPYYLFMSHPLLSLSLFTIYFILSFLIILNSKLSLFLSSYLQDPSSNKYKQKILLQFSSVFLPVIFRLNYLPTLE